MALFIDPTIEFEKVAAEVILPEDPNAWPTEVLQELYKQVPYIADFEPHVVMDRVDAERGFGFGHVDISTKSEMQQGATEAGKDAAGLKTARIPVIIKDRKLQAFDVIVTEDSEMLPLTESRMRQAVFRPSAFDITGRSPGDQSMVSQLYPPYRQNYGFGGGGATMGVGMGKQAASEEKCCPKCKKEKCACGFMDKGASLISAILPTINGSDHQTFLSHFSDQKIAHAFEKNHWHTTDVLSKLAHYRPISLTKTSSAFFSKISPTVIQVRKEGGGYLIKSANHQCWLPREEKRDRGQIVRAFGEKVAMTADSEGSVTMGMGEMSQSEIPQPEKDKYEPVSQFGIYKVRDDKDRELIGYVFTNLIDIDGTPLPISLFTNGSQSAVQTDIAGVSIGSGANLFEGHPRGHGVFYQVLSNGRAQATIPMTIQASLSGPNGDVVMKATTFDGREVEVMIQPNIQGVMPAGDNRVCIAETMSWLPLDNTEDVVLAGQPDVAETQSKMAQSRHLRTVLVRCGGQDNYSIDGLPLSKLASDQKGSLSFDDALFLLTGLGVSPPHAVSKLAQAYTISAPVEVTTGREIALAKDVMSESYKTASEHLANFPSLKIDLVKEAAMIPDPVAVDTVLSLGFLNPENVHMFIGYLPLIDEAQKRMCELLVASRLGLKEVPASPLEKAIRSVEQVVEGLKVMALGQ